MIFIITINTVILLNSNSNLLLYNILIMLFVLIGKRKEVL